MEISKIEAAVIQAQRLTEMNEEHLYFLLGVEVFYLENPKFKKNGIRASAPYQQIGLSFFSDTQNSLYKLLCDSKSKKPKFDSENDWFQIAVVLLGAIDVAGTSVLPSILAILMKIGLNKFCKLDFKTNGHARTKKVAAKGSTKNSKNRIRK